MHACRCASFQLQSTVLLHNDSHVFTSTLGKTIGTTLLELEFVPVNHSGTKYTIFLHICIVFFHKQTTCRLTITDLHNTGMDQVKTLSLSNLVQSLVKQHQTRETPQQRQMTFIKPPLACA